MRRSVWPGRRAGGANGCDVVLQARWEDPTAFTAPLPPLSEILDDDQRTSYRSWRRMLSAHRTGSLPSRPDAAELVSSLDGLSLDLMAADLTDGPEREAVVEVMPAVSGRSAADPIYLRSRAAEGRGDVQRHEMR